MERDAFEAAEHGDLRLAEELHADRQRDEEAHSRLQDSAIAEFIRIKNKLPNAAELDVSQRDYVVRWGSWRTRRPNRRIKDTGIKFRSKVTPTSTSLLA